jgi:hypothetical protein
MPFHVIAQIKFEAKVVVHPQSIPTYIELDSPLWTEIGDAYVKDEEIARYTLTKTSNDEFVLVIEHIDLFGIDIGKWTDEQYPERKALIDSILREIENILGAKITVKEIRREVL